MLSGLAGLGMVQQNPLGSLYGSVGTNTTAGLGGLTTGLQSANSGNDLLQLAALLGGSQTCSAPASKTGACAAASNAGRGTASRDTETNRDRGDYTSGGACEN